MYKDPEKQREANRERQRRYKERHKGVTSEGVTDKALPQFEDIIGLHLKGVPKRTAQGNIRVSKPGDPDYTGVA